jgi:hypothetical protein
MPGAKEREFYSLAFYRTAGCTFDQKRMGGTKCAPRSRAPHMTVHQYVLWHHAMQRRPFRRFTGFTASLVDVTRDNRCQLGGN